MSFSVLASFGRWAAYSLAVWLCAVSLHAHAADENTHYTYTNRLIDSANPYLLLHAHNPVDWYPWGAEAIDRARRENKPIFLSIGYSTCYWCHVAERTLFSRPEIATLMNAWFINIKVDREERPDIDAVYLLATQLITGSAAGWPNNVFLTPDLAPFYGGGYFPPDDDEFGHPGFPGILTELHQQWIDQPERLKQRGQGVLDVLRKQQSDAIAAHTREFDPTAWLRSSRAALLSRFDPVNGGMSSSTRQTTKFPQSPALLLMLRDYELKPTPETAAFLTVTLDAMAYGGIYDQLGGGFHRYATERTWSIPHFEKMLYDNAQLLTVYSRAWRLFGKPQYKRIAAQQRNWLVTQMMAPTGGFYTALDAAAERVEGASYIWSRSQIGYVLGADAQPFFDAYTLTALPEIYGIPEPESAPSVLRAASKGVESGEVESRIARVESQRARLLQARSSRVQPGGDEKILVGLNGLAIDALIESDRVFGTREEIRFARRAATTLWQLAWDPKRRRLSHQIYRGQAKGAGFLDDYGLFGAGLLTVYQATHDDVWLQRARLVADAMLREFDPARSGILKSTPLSATSAADQGIPLILTALEQGDDAYPSGISAAVQLLARLSATPNGKRYALDASRIARNVPGRPEQWPVLIAAVNPLGARSPFAPAVAETPAASASGTAAHVRARGLLRRGREHDEVVVVLAIEAGFHINANPASFDFLVPTSVKILGVNAVEMEYPPAQPFKSDFAPDVLQVYAGTVTIVARVQRGLLDRVHPLRATVEAQACTQSICLPPSRIALTIDPGKSN